MISEVWGKSKRRAQVEWPGLSIIREFVTLSITAEPVEKVQQANSDNFRTVKNHHLTARRKRENDQI